MKQTWIQVLAAAAIKIIRILIPGKRKKKQ